MRQFFPGILTSFLPAVHTFERIGNSWPWTPDAGRRSLASPLKYWKFPAVLGGMFPPSLLTRSQWNTLGHNSKTRLSSHLKLRYQFFVFIEAYTCYKNQHHSSIQSYHITYLTLRITFDMPKCTWPHQYEWTESNRYICVCLPHAKS